MTSTCGSEIFHSHLSFSTCHILWLMGEFIQQCCRMGSLSSWRGRNPLISARAVSLRKSDTSMTLQRSHCTEAATELGKQVNTISIWCLLKAQIDGMQFFHDIAPSSCKCAFRPRVSYRGISTVNKSQTAQTILQWLAPFTGLPIVYY